MKDLETYLNGDNDQPTTCPKCGMRTDWEAVAALIPLVQIHTCLRPECGYRFILEFEPEEPQKCTSTP